MSGGRFLFRVRVYSKVSLRKRYCHFPIIIPNTHFLHFRQKKNNTLWIILLILEILFVLFVAKGILFLVINAINASLQGTEVRQLYFDMHD